MSCDTDLVLCGSLVVLRLSKFGLLTAIRYLRFGFMRGCCSGGGDGSESLRYHEKKVSVKFGTKEQKKRLHAKHINFNI
ncbi:hypothetical protein BpHYR1_039095 [Brachionus plicatilis]|uniref:Uncharacterized protein n=1 Tax=Brachionus plicatilis TaxID=10195 RepID=A0A3M7RZ67_BRAPC|nr:hypothetical protein BpHYR1_039095 [Brachionus plicatilis]